MPRSILHRAAALALASLLFAGLLASSPRAAAQDQSPFTLAAQVGYQDVYRIGDWFPVFVDVGNSGPDVSGVLEWSFPGQLDEQVFRQQVDLPRGSRKRVTMNIFAGGTPRNGRVQLMEGQTVLASQDIGLNSIDEGVFLSVVVSPDAAMLNSLDALRVAGFSGARVRHMAAADLPDQIATLRAVNAIFLHDTDTSALSSAQRDALGVWVSLGGQLVVSGGVGAQRTAAGVDNLLPAQVSGTVTQGDLAPLARFAGVSSQSLAASASVNQLQPRAGAENIPAGSGLLQRWHYGSGWAIVTAFDFASLRSWPGEPQLWSSALEQPASLMPIAGGRLSRTNLLDRGVLQLPSLNLPSPSTLLLFLLAYIVVIGPLNYVVLRRLRRLEWAWLTVPAIVLIFAGGLYAVGNALRGGEAQFNQAAVVQAAEGQPRGAATAFIGLFSPRRAAYNIGFAPNTLVTNTAGRASLSDQFDTLVTDANGARSVNILADIASVNTFVAHTIVDVPVSVETKLISDTNGLRGQIRNAGPSALEDVMLVRGDAFVRLGTLAPGAAQQVGGAMQPNFPRAVGLSRSGVFDRQEMMNLLFDRDFARLSNPGAAGSTPTDDSIYLLAWVNQPTVAATVDGQPANQDGLTLYVIRLRPPQTGVQ